MFKVFIILCLSLFLSACGGGSGGDSESPENTESIPNNNEGAQEFEVDVVAAEQYFDLVGAPVTQDKELDYFGLIDNYQLEEYENNLNVRLKENASTTLYTRSAGVNLAEYSAAGSIDGHWVSSCINYKEVSTNGNGVEESTYYSKIIRREFSELQGAEFVDVFEYGGLGCKRGQLIQRVDRVYSTLVLFPSEIVDGFYQVFSVFAVDLSGRNVVDFPRRFLISNDGDSFIIMDGDKTYTLYNRI
ncbi:MAG: hypothetical protein CMD81_01165 [Gammaproteobacteria bacterium]|nr:hypothetical protein [Gammaproteobacteria bacterium]|tara:strand:+ start:1809 stop:2543 length:735 start_codon:yes stop_codon:yes gene_type:complete